MEPLKSVWCVFSYDEHNKEDLMTIYSTEIAAKEAVERLQNHFINGKFFYEEITVEEEYTIRSGKQR